MSNRRFRVDLSTWEQTQEGRFLSHLYYDTQFLDVFNRNERTGFPHNGGRHTLTLTATKEDIDTFLELIKEFFPAEHKRHVGAQAFITMAQERLAEQLMRRNSPVVVHESFNN